MDLAWVNPTIGTPTITIYGRQRTDRAINQHLHSTEEGQGSKGIGLEALETASVNRIMQLHQQMTHKANAAANKCINIFDNFISIYPAYPRRLPVCLAAF